MLRLLFWIGLQIILWNGIIGGINLMNLTQQAIKFLSTEELMAALKEDLDPDVHDMISYELFEIRETT